MSNRQLPRERNSEIAVEAKANVNAQDKDGLSALHAVADGGQLNVVEALKSAGAEE